MVVSVGVPVAEVLRVLRARGASARWLTVVEQFPAHCVSRF